MGPCTDFKKLTQHIFSTGTTLHFIKIFFFSKHSLGLRYKSHIH
jgi:hypothetical protein